MTEEFDQIPRQINRKEDELGTSVLSNGDSRGLENAWEKDTKRSLQKESEM